MGWRRRRSHADLALESEQHQKQPGYVLTREQAESSLKGRGRSRRGWGGDLTVFSVVPGGFGRASPQPGSRRSARSVARTNGLDAGEDDAILVGREGHGGVAGGVELSVTVFMVPNEDRVWRGRGSGCRSSLRRAGGEHEAVRPQPGRGQSGRPRQRVGVMTRHGHAPRLRPDPHAAPLARARISPSRSP